ncbi:MAG: RraA family protein, partial [Pseudomonadota bacterium]
MTAITTQDLQRLQQWDTPTICNGLEVIDPDRRNGGFTIDPFVCLNADLAPVIGYARTATIRAQQPSSHPHHQALRLDYYHYIASGPSPSIVVIEDLDEQAGVGAFWGEVNTSIHLGLGVGACITNGSMRDLPDAAPGFQLLAGSVGPSHAHV